MTNGTDSRLPEEVIFERYWAHACAQCHGRTEVEMRNDCGGYYRQPVDTLFLSKLEGLLVSVSDTRRFREEVQWHVAQLVGTLRRMPTTAEILKRLPDLANAIDAYVDYAHMRRAA